MVIELRPYQEATVSAAIEPKEPWRRLLVLATGAGKTVIAAEILNRVLENGQSALFLAHRDELITQAKSEIQGFVPDLHVEVEQAENRASREQDERRRVVIGSVQTLRGKRLKSWDPKTFSIVVIDEAHHGAANTYQSIVKHFGCMDDEVKTPLLGVTATPMRSDKVGLDILFQELSASYNIADLVEQGYLCDIKGISVRTETDLRKVRVTAGDYNARDLEEAVDDENRNGLILSAHRKYAAERPTIVFAAGVDHAQNLAEMFGGNGVTAEAVWGAMEEDERKGALARYASGETMVLTHYNILTEGFNAPQTSCIILGRPTKSALVMTQAIGRGTRLHPGKDHCLVIDIRDVTSGKSLCTAATLASLPADFNLSGKSMFEAARDYARLKQMNPSLAEQALSPDEVEKFLEYAEKALKAREIRLLPRRPATVSPPDGGYESPFLWMKRGTDHYEVSPDKGTSVYRVYREDGRWAATASYQGSENVITRESDMYEAVRTTDLFIASSHRNVALIDKHAPWALEPPSEKQQRFLRGRGLPVPRTKGAAVQRISGIMARSGRPVYA